MSQNSMISLGTDWHYCHELKAWLSGILAVPHTHVSSISPSTPWQAQVEDMPGRGFPTSMHFCIIKAEISVCEEHAP